MKYYWGLIFIGFGILQIALDPLDKLDAHLLGAPNTALTVTLLGLAILISVTALVAQPSIKALLILWIVAP